MVKPELPALRFGVRAVSGHRASTWRLWTPGGGKNDIYLGCRALGGELKISMHERHVWHTSFSPEFFATAFPAESPKPEKRFIDTWPRPRQTFPGVTLATKIYVPQMSPSVLGEDRDEVVWVPPAAEGEAVVFYVMLIEPPCVIEINSWPGRVGMKSLPVGSLPVGTGETAWVVYRNEPMPAMPTGDRTVRLFAGVNKEDVQGPNLRAILFGEEKDGTRTMLDMAVERNAK